jgi:hypothetical protein
MVTGIALLCATALTVAGCKNSNQLFEDNNDGGWFSKPVQMFKTPDWAKPANTNTAELGPSGPVGPDELVNADGSCAMAAVPAPPPVTPDQPSDAPVVNTPAGPQVMGGVALGMSECQVVQRAGNPSNVQIGAGASGERSVTLTFLNPPWPGIYRFSDGRLKVVERAPTPPPTAKAPPKKKKTAKKRPEKTS